MFPITQFKTTKDLASARDNNTEHNLVMWIHTSFKHENKLEPTICQERRIRRLKKKRHGPCPQNIHKLRGKDVNTQLNLTSVSLQKWIFFLISLKGTNIYLNAYGYTSK